MTDFCHLHVHSEHSQLDGVGTSDDYAREAKRLGQTALAITDHGNVDGILKHQKACKKHGIVPVLGCELYIVPDMRQRTDGRWHLTALVRSREGLTNLMHMISLANLEGFYRRPRIDPELLLNHAEGLVFLTACIGSFVNMPGGEELLVKLRDLAPTFLEIMPHKHQKQINHNRTMALLSSSYGIPLVATNDCHYPLAGMGETQDVLLAVQRKAKWTDTDRWSMSRDWPGLHLRSADEMVQAFIRQSCLEPSVWQNAMYRTMEVAALCNGYTVERMPVELPRVHGHGDRDETDLMWEIVADGWGRRDILPGREVEYEARVNEEMGLICRMGFQRYFLIVHELISWCREQGIMVGPGRGSSGGSLVCYLMGITDVDPLRYGLIFARFISPERVDYPDIDMDFESARRDEVVGHLRDCYGEGNVVGISTFMTMKGKGALRDVARVFDVPLADVDPAAKAVPDIPDGDDRAGHAIEDGLKDIPELITFQRKYPDVVRHAINLEGQVRGYGKHAAGMCVNSRDLRLGHHCSLRVHDGVVSANWSKDDAEHMGLMKLDVLGLDVLSFLGEAVRLIKENRGMDIDLNALPLDDPEVYREIAAGNTAGAFQIGSNLNIRWCRELGVREFNDIVLINALTRPGPLKSGVSDQFLCRRRGQERVAYLPRMEPYTRETLGLVLFQEQVMWAMNQVAGLPWGECDKVRKVIGKSKGSSAFQEFKGKFVDGCGRQGTLTAAKADHVWDELASFGAYAFNKCLTGDTVLERGACGQYQKGPEITIRQLYDNWSSKESVGGKYRRVGVNILQMKHDGRIRPGKVKGVYYQGKRPTVVITTERGFNIKTTWNHKFPTEFGDRTVSQLSIGDKLFIKGRRFSDIRKDQKKELSNPSSLIGKTYSGCGFQEGEDNISWNGGSSKYLKQSKKIIEKRANGKCEKCGRDITKICGECGSIIRLERCEFAHVKTLEQCDYDFKKYHNPENILYLCNPCHKKFDYAKGERKVRHAQGRVTELDQIVSIKATGIEEDVFDVEMEGPEHNFVANGIVTCNSHAVEYSLLGYWCMILKVKWPLEFLCGCLSHCRGEKASVYVDEARRLGIPVELPKAGVSLADKWLVRNGILWAPLTAIKGVGDSQAEKILGGKAKQVAGNQDASKNQGFFQPSFGLDGMQPPQVQAAVRKPGNQMEVMLRKAGYYRERSLNFEELKEAAPLYDFNVMTGGERFRRLGGLGEIPERDLLACHLPKGANLIEIARYILPPIECRDCNLINECTRPVQPSFGRYNLMIIGEAPGKDEDQQGIGFVGRAGMDILWPELARHGIAPEMLHITNVCKCWPSKTKTPSKREITACSRWLEMEIAGLRPIMILAFGGTGVKALRGEGKISELNGQTVWSDRWQCWISWCLHPASVLHNPGNRSEFGRGIENFAHRVMDIGGNAWGAWMKEHVGKDWHLEYPGICPHGGDFGRSNGLYAECAGCASWERCALAAAACLDWTELGR